MPSIDAVEQFKSIVQALAREPEIREQMGLPPDEILPPESQLDDLADLLGGMPTSDDGGQESVDPSTEDEPASEAASDLDDLFSVPVPEPHEEPSGPSLDDLFSELAPAPADDPLEAPDLPEMESSDFLETLDEVGPVEIGSDVLDDLGSFDSSLLDEPLPESGFETETEPPLNADSTRSTRGVSPEDLDDSFFETPGEELFSSGTADESPEDDFEFGDSGMDADFPELAGFADTKAEDVEAFDAMGEADEFQLGDFESQFGITADDHTDAELLNPAQSVDLASVSAQRDLSYSDEEFATIQKALLPLPLNLRLAIEELIGEKEVVLDDLDKVVRLLLGRTQLRTLANAVGKILGRKITIPVGFEKGSGSDLEARYGSLWYNLQTAMWPTIKIALMATVAAAILVLLGWNFLYRPLKANSLYDQGLAAVRANNGVRGDQLFAEAYYEWPSDDRFFQYAAAYLDTGDYDRARRKYLELLRPSVKPYNEDDKAVLTKRYGSPLEPLPKGLAEPQLLSLIAQRKAVVDAYYDYVVRLLSASQGGAGIEGDIPAEVILKNPNERGILDYSQFESDFGFEGLDPEAHYRRANIVLATLLDRDRYDGKALLRKADNLLDWGQTLSSHDALDQANTALSDYLRHYGFNAPVTWRFIRLFMMTDKEAELLRLRDRIALDVKMPVDGEVMAQFAGWLLDHEAARKVEATQIVEHQKTIDQEYGVLPTTPAPPAEGTAPARPSIDFARSEGNAQKIPELKPPYKYPRSSQLYQPDYLASVDTLLLRAMDTQKTLPELHYQLSRFYRLNDDTVNEKKALAAADAYFQRLPLRSLRLQGRPELRVATSLRIGEIFDSAGQPLQAEKYYLDAQRVLTEYRDQGLISNDQRMANVYKNLGNLLYRQAPGVTSTDSGNVPGAWDQAAQLYAFFEADRGNDPEVTYRQGVISYEKQHFDQAVRRFFSLDRQLAKGEISGRDNPNLLYSMGNALFRSGDFAAAEGYYRELINLLTAQRARITEWDPIVHAAHRALAQRLYEAWNNLAAAEYRANTVFQSGTPEFREALVALTKAKAQAQVLGTELFEDHSELDITKVDQSKLNAIRQNEASVVDQTRKEKGLIEANLQVLSMIEKATPYNRQALLEKLEIFARIPLELNQTSAP